MAITYLLEVAMKRLTLQERITQFRNKHNDRYSYELVTDDIRWNSKILITCPDHGPFYQIVNNHNRGAGCPACYGNKKISKQERIKQALVVHGSRYDYSLWPKDIGASSMVRTICKDHGIWVHSVASHVNHKSGCPDCAGQKPRDREKFLTQAKQAHGDKYLYPSNVGYSNNDLVIVECRIHGLFSQTVTNHIAGKGCSSCQTGFDRSAPAWLYILKSNGVFKVGVTNNLEARIKFLKTCTPFEFSVDRVKYFNTGKEAEHEEKDIMNSSESAGHVGFNGCTEWRKGGF